MCVNQIDLWQCGMLHRFMRYSYIYEARMSPALNGSSVIRRFEGNDAIEICDGITFDFYTGLPHLVYIILNQNPLLNYSDWSNNAVT